VVNICQNSLIMVDLTDTVWIYTSISPENHAALRSGFAGYPANPRWSAIKYRAWKQGYQWREGLSQGKLTIRESDSQLVPATELIEITTVKANILSKQLLVSCS